MIKRGQARAGMAEATQRDRGPWRCWNETMGSWQHQVDGSLSTRDGRWCVPLGGALSQGGEGKLCSFGSIIKTVD